jgi:hypothetical protein
MASYRPDSKVNFTIPISQDINNTIYARTMGETLLIFIFQAENYKNCYDIALQRHMTRSAVNINSGPNKL